MKYREMTAEQRKAEFEKVSAEFEAWKAKGLKLNMARGRPGKEQLDLVSDILSVMTDPADCVDGDVNVRNYGELSGLPSAKRAVCRDPWLQAGAGASSAATPVAARSCTTPSPRPYTQRAAAFSEKPWCQRGSVSSGSAPRRAMTATSRSRSRFGFELITIPMTDDGTRYGHGRSSWSRTRRSRACGTCRSIPIPTASSTPTRPSSASPGMKPAAPDFLLMWDNAYCIHEFEGEFVPFPDILSLCREVRQRRHGV